MSLLSALLDLIFPAKCPFCGRVLDRPGICDTCRGELPWTEGADALRRGPGGFLCAAPLWYQGLAREGLHRFKFRGMSSAAAPLGELIAGCAAEHFSGAFDTVTWVPVSPRRLRQRGYDQARLLAEDGHRVHTYALSGSVVTPTENLTLADSLPLLRKTVHNPAQSGLKEAAARRANVLGVYEAVDPERISGHRILLVDDICTTGATLAECARVLREAGAADVVCAAAALTPLERDSGKKA